MTDNEIITVTQPFLSNFGKQYLLIGRLNTTGGEKLLCQDFEGNEILILIDYTNLKKQDLFQEQANGRCDFRYEDLQSLFELIEDLQKNV